MPLMTDRLKVFVPPTESSAILPINVKDPAFGAVGDGVTDDQAAIQAAITAAAGNGIVYFPPGTYYLNSTGALSIVRSGTQDVQTLTTTGTPGGGTFTLTFGGSTTAAIVYNASAAVVAAALNLLPTIIAAGGVQATGGALPTGVVIRFNQLGARALLTSTDSLTGGTAPATAIAHTTTGTGTATNSLHIMGAGAGATTIKLSSTVVRAFDLTRTADYDVFQNIELSDLTVDCDSQVGGTSNQHVLFGNLISGGGTVAQRVNVRNVAIRRCRTVNVPTPATAAGNRQNVAIYSRHAAGSEPQTRLEDILIEDCDFSGGNVGVAVIGTNASAATTSEVRHDRIRINRVRWNSNKIPDGANPSAAGIQIGGLGFGGSCVVSNCHLTGADDVGLEIDGMTYSTVENTVIEDCYTSLFFVRNFHASENPGAQIARLRGCDARITSAFNPVTGKGQGFVLHSSTAPTATFGHVVLDKCSFYSSQTTTPGLTGQAIVLSDCAVSKVTTRNFQVVYDALTYTNASGTNRPTPVLIASTADCLVEMYNTHVKLSGACTVSSGSNLLRPFYLTAASSSKMRFTLDGFFLEQGITGVTNSGRYVALGEETGTMSGTVRRFKVVSHAGGDTTPRYIWLGAAATLTVDDGIVIQDCDFLQGPSGQTEVFYNGTTENRDKVVLRSNAYRSSTALDFASAATLIVPDSDQTINITGATGPITAINALRNGAVLSMRFASTPTVTAGATLKLAAAANFVATADDILVLSSDGTNFREVSRSANA